MLIGLFVALAHQLEEPRTYLAPQAKTPLTIDGKLDETLWVDSPWTEDFVDILGPQRPKPRYRTRAKMGWDSINLYIAAEMEEPNLWATLTDHDAVIYHDNDFEVFLDPNGDTNLYAELELNALNTTWDLLLVKPYRDGGPALDGWEIKGLQTAVSLRGTLNDMTDVDAGWSVEIAIPWTAVKEIAGCPCPPRAGDTWRINFSRVEWQVESVDGRISKVSGIPEDNWVWSPQGAIDMHRPEKWGRLTFAGPVSQ